jgi:hypothetical protein
MRNIIKETLNEFNFEKNRKLILSLLNETILPNYKWVCKFDVEPLLSSNNDSIMILIYLKPSWGHQVYDYDKYNLIDVIWTQVYEWIGIATYAKCVTIDHCDRENLTESRRDRVMTDYFNDLFNVAEMNWRHPIEYEDFDEYEDTTRTKFYIGSEFDDDVVFYYYDEHYFTPDSGMQDKSPLMVVEDKYKIKLDGYFGEKWHEPFKKWFKENFGLEIKTIDTD